MPLWYVILEYSNHKDDLVCVKVLPTPTPPSLYRVSLLNTKPLFFSTAIKLAKDYAKQNKVFVERA